ncbi:MAG: fibronectin type III domain-containing protein, partial [Nitrospirota bacterium]
MQKKFLKVLSHFLKASILGLIILFLLGFALSAHAATVTWTGGGGSDNLASNSANWSGGIIPQYGDDVIIDSTSKDCTWDLTVTLASLSIKSGYTGKVTKISGVSLTIAKNFTSPTPPSGLSATAISSSQINLSWTDNSNNETGFKIERKIDVGGIYSQIAIVGANVITYSDTGLTAGTTYYYRVSAYNSFGDSAPSNEASATTLTAPPTAVTDPATNVTHDSARINGTVNPNGNNTTAYFELGTDTSYELFTSSPISVGSGTNNVIVFADITGFSPGATYHYRVFAVNAGGTRSNGSDVSFTTNPLPGAIQVNATLNGVTWTGSVSYTITGPETINGASAPATFTGKQVGSYTLTYNSGGPANAILSSITPSATQTLPSQGTITFTLNFIYSPPTATTNPATNVNGT